MSALPVELWASAGLGSFVAIDLETTGLDPSEDAIIELGAVKFEVQPSAVSHQPSAIGFHPSSFILHPSVVSRFSQLVNPGRKLPREITELTGITDADLKNAPNLADVADEFLEFVGDLPLVGHHIYFDLGFLEAAPEFNEKRKMKNEKRERKEERAELSADPSDSSHFSSFIIHRSLKGHPFSKANTIPRAHDTGLIARFLAPCRDGYGLGRLWRLFNFGTLAAESETTPQSEIRNPKLSGPHHRAADDAAATGELFALLLPQLAAAPQPQLARALGFIEGTASPFANTLRAVISALESGYRPTEPPPDPLEGVAGKENIFVATGEHRPTEPATNSQIQRLFNDAARFNAVLPGYEIRREQTAMAGLVSQAFRDKTLLLVEAGTGVGKSLGYLVPALLSGGRVVVSTHTKNLQDQLFYDEIPRLGKLFKFSFRAALLKGRRNYLCRSRWLTLAATPERIGSPAVREQAALIVRWADATQTGDVSEIAAVMGNSAGSLFNHIVSEPGYCTSRVCGGPTECPLPRIRRAAQLADIVVVNHSLVLSDLDSEGGLLGDAKRIIFDEAHHLEEVATDAFSIDLTTYSFRDALDRVGRLCRRNGELWVRLAADNEFSGLVPTAEQAANDAGELKQPVDALFDALQATLALAGLKGWMSAAEPGRTENKPQYPTPFRYHTGDLLQQALAEAGQPLLAGLKGFGGRLNRIAERLREVPEERFPPAIVQELLNALNEIAELHDGLGVVLEGDDENRVFWVDLPSEKEKPIRLRAAPLDVSLMLRDGLWQKLDSATLTSATLATAPGAAGFDHLRARLGLTELPDGRVRSAVFGSPFDYPRNCLVCYPSHLPSPTEDAAEHCRAVAAICAGLAMKLRRNTLLLFTSYDALWRVERELKRALLGTGLELLVGGRIGRERLVRRFRKSTGALLLGTDAFWEGIDVPGEALEMVVIPRLPFDVPNDPVVAARIDKIRESGGNPFYDYQIPTAVLRLRQGAGRLIRTTTDRGVVLILDPRVVTKGYGRHFRNALPGISVTLDSDEALMQRIGEFFQ